MVNLNQASTLERSSNSFDAERDGLEPTNELQNSDYCFDPDATKVQNTVCVELKQDSMVV